MPAAIYSYQSNDGMKYAVRTPVLLLIKVGRSEGSKQARGSAAYKRAASKKREDFLLCWLLLLC